MQIKWKGHLHLDRHQPCGEMAQVSQCSGASPVALQTKLLPRTPTFHIRALAQVLATELLVQLSANVPQKATENASGLGALPPTWKNWVELWTLGFCPDQPLDY